jgi:hypothetical protein
MSGPCSADSFSAINTQMRITKVDNSRDYRGLDEKKINIVGVYLRFGF